MFERYNEQARRVLFFSRYEASQSIESEHVLLGLVRERKGIVGRIFEASHVSLDDIRNDVARLRPARDKLATSVEIPFSAETKRILQFAAEEADSLEHKHIGPEHLFLGILREPESFAATVLTDRGVRLSDARREVAALLTGPPVEDSFEAREDATRHQTALEKQDPIELITRIDGIKAHVEQLGEVVSDSAAARSLLTRIHEELDALKRCLEL